MFTVHVPLLGLARRLCHFRHPTSIHRGTNRTTYRGIPSRHWFSSCNPSRSENDKSSAASEAFRFIYEPIEDLEPFERYVAGGYCPVRLGDRFCSSRYHIVHKLGHGTFSTSWLAWDEHLSQLVAIKFAVSDLDRPFESAILKSLHHQQDSNATANPGIDMLPKVLHEFEVEGPDISGARGKHRCFVTSPARMSIADAREVSDTRMFQPIVAHAIAAQIIHAVAFLHSRGVVHADLHEANILLRLPGPTDNTPPDTLYEQYGQPMVETISRLDGKSLDTWVPAQGVLPIWRGAASETISLPESRIFLIDFDESFRPAVEDRLFSRTPMKSRSPELLLEPSSQVSFPTEIWSLACVVFAVMGQHHPFDTFFPSKDRILEEQTEALGMIPRDMRAKWPRFNEVFDDQLRRIDGTLGRSLEDRLESYIQQSRKESGMEEMNDEEVRSFLALMKAMLAFRHSGRPTAQQVLESEWVQKWANPSFELLMKNSAPSGSSY